MNERKDLFRQITEYEKQLLADREQLRKLLEEYGADNDAIITDKLCFFQNELKHITHQYTLLKDKLEISSEASEIGISSNKPNETSLISTQPQKTPYKETEQPALDHVTLDTYTFSKSSPVSTRNFNPTKSKTNIEKLVGSSLMGILASGLIFISLILFATLIMPYLGNAVKLAACYAISFLIIGISLWKLQKNKTNKFYLALAGCGTGALYITLLLTNIYFKYIGDLTLFVLIAVWVGFVCYLSKSRNPIFHIIGQIGITVSIIFGCILCVETESTSKFVSLIIFFAISFCTLYITHFDWEITHNKIGNIFCFINLISLLFSNFFMESDICYFLISMLSLAVLVALLFEKWELSKYIYGVFVALYFLLFSLSAMGYIHNKKVWGIIFYLISLALLVRSQYKPKVHKQGAFIIQITTISVSLFAFAFLGTFFEHGFVWFLIFPIAIFGFWSQNNICKYGSLILTFLYITGRQQNILNHLNTIEILIFGFVVLLSFYLLMLWKKADYTTSIKIILHLLGIVYFLIPCQEVMSKSMETEETVSAVLFILISVYNLAMFNSPFSKNLINGEKDANNLYNFINFVLMGTGLLLINETSPLHIPVILVTLLLFMHNNKNFLNRQSFSQGGIYVGFKFTLLLIVILNSFDAVNYIISSLCLLFAVACVVFGFFRSYKSLRIYGLLLSMVSVFKLIMVDMQYENTLGNAISFFLSGILCFAISMIYNYIDKKITDEKNESE